MALPKYKLSTGGNWHEAARDDYFETYNPYTGKPWALIPRCGAADAERAIRSALRQAVVGGKTSNQKRSFLFMDDLDSVKVDPAHHNVVFENDQIRVVRWVVAAGDKTLKHSHPNNLNINLTDYNGRVTTPDRQASEVHAKAGSVSWRQAGIHVVENIGSQRMEGIIVEPKKPASA